MAKEFSRSRRVAEQIQRELADLITHEIDLPESGIMVTVSSVDVSRDLTYAKVYITVMPSSDNRKEILKLLNQAAGYLRHHLGQRVTMRRIPELSFYYDNSIEEGARMSALINEAVAKDKK
ncbi:MAG: 30S ribosome-binding factor RbfA [Gammaproteobacteria bacterium]|nr:30S ribosome-binding factor RbfA [Gammaproteobacteria bacterium]